MNPYLLYAKIAGCVVLVAIVATSFWHLGGLSKQAELDAFKTAVEASHAAQLQAVVDTMTQHDKQAAAERAADKGVIDAYELDRSLPPATAGLVERMRVVEATACSARDSELPSAPILAGGSQAACGIPRGDPTADRLLQNALDAAERDAKRLNTLTRLAP